MPTYVLLMNLTDQGIRTIKGAPERIAAAIETWESMGGSMRSFHMTMGAYDYVAIGEAPSDEAAATFLLGLGALGNVKTTTLKAFSREEAASIIASLP